MNREPAEFEKAAERPRTGLWREIFDLLRHNKKWWLAPIIIILVVVGSLIALALVAPGAAPFIYTLF